MPDFDPNEYLKSQRKSNGFDPNKYLEANPIQKKSEVQNDLTSGTQTSKRGFEPFQSPVDTKTPSILTPKGKTEYQEQVKDYVPPKAVQLPKEEKPDFFESVKNSLSNVGTGVQQFIPNTAIALSETLQGLLGKDLGSDFYRNIVGSANNPELDRQEAYAKLVELEPQFKKTRGLIESAENFDVAGLAAATVDAMSSLVRTAITSAPTAGIGLASDMVGGSIASYNQEKAKSKGISVDELYKRGENEFAIPATIGAIGTGLEAIGLKGTIGLINKKLTGSFAKKFATTFVDVNKEGLTEFLQTGLDASNKALSQGKSVADASKVAVDEMFSKKGLESYLMGVVGSAGSAGVGRVVKGMLPTNKKKATEATQKIAEMESELSNPDISPATQDFIAENIRQNVAEVADAIENDANEVEGLSDEQKFTINSVNEIINSYEEVLLDPNASEQTKKLAQERINRLDLEIDNILEGKKLSPETQALVESKLPPLEKPTIDTEEQIIAEGKKSNKIAEIESILSNDDAVFAETGSRPLLSEARAELKAELEKLRQEQGASKNTTPNAVVGQPKSKEDAKKADYTKRIEKKIANASEEKNPVNKALILYDALNSATRVDTGQKESVQELLNAHLAESGLKIENVEIGTKYNETNTSLDATIAGVGFENLKVIEVLSPIIRDANGVIVKQGKVIVESSDNKQSPTQEQTPKAEGKKSDIEIKLEKPFKQKNDGSGLVSVKSSKKEKDGLITYSLETTTTNKNGEERTQPYKSYNTVEELIQDLGITNEDDIEILKELSKTGTIAVKEVRFFDNSGAATIMVGGDTVEMSINDVSEFTKSPTQEAPKAEVLPQFRNKKNNREFAIITTDATGYRTVVEIAKGKKTAQNDNRPIDPVIGWSKGEPIIDNYGNEYKSIEDYIKANHAADPISQSTTQEAEVTPKESREVEEIKAKETEVAKLEKEYEKLSKALSVNLKENQQGMFENKPQSMFDDKSDQSKIVKAKKAELDKAKSELKDLKDKAEREADKVNQQEIEFTNEEDYTLNQVEKTNDPEELASLYYQQESAEPDYKTEGIMDYLGTRTRINLRDWKRYNDENNLTPAIRRRYIDSTNKSGDLDANAMELSEQLGIEITPDDFANVILDFGSTKEYKAQSKTKVQKAISDKYYELTGKKLTEGRAERAYFKIQNKPKTDKELYELNESLQEIGITYEDIQNYNEYAKQESDGTQESVQATKDDAGTSRQLRGESKGVQKEDALKDVEVSSSTNSISGLTKITYKLGDVTATVIDYNDEEPMGVEGMPSWAKSEHYIENIFRDKDNNKSKGLGRVVLLKIIQNARNQGKDVVTAKMEERSGKSLRDYYHELGFKDIGEAEPFGLYIDLRTNKPIEFIEKVIADKSNKTNEKAKTEEVKRPIETPRVAEPTFADAFTAIEEAKRSKKTQKGKLEVAEQVVKEMGEVGKKAIFIDNNFKEIIAKIKEFKNDKGEPLIKINCQ